MEQTNLLTLLKNYSLENIYNTDKFGLFFNCFPDRFYQLKSEKYSGGKHSTQKITGLVAANAAGEKSPMFATGKSKTKKLFQESHYHAGIGINP